MPLTGGDADKVGNRYELILTVLCMTDVMNERADSMRLEPVGVEGDGVEFWLKKGEKKEYYQVKRQHSVKGHWSLSDLENYNILTRFAEKLRISENNYCVFVSIQDALPLRELAERAKDAESLEEFKTEFINKGRYSDDFEDFCSRSKIPDERTAYGALKRIVVEPIGERFLTDSVEERLATLVEGNPEAIRKILAVWALEKIHKELIAHDIWSYLEKLDYSPSKLGRGTHDFDTVKKQNERYLSNVKESAICNEIIARDEVGIILDHLYSSNGKHGVLISGEAGIGKSSVIVQVIEKLLDKNWPVLAFRIDRLDLRTQLPEMVGRQLGLRDSPAKVLAALSKGRDCVLVIDQLDTVSKASGRHHEFFECIEEIINQTMKQPQIKLLLACRKFDLENDPRLRKLTGERGLVDTVSVNYLSDETVKNVVNRLGLDSRRLNQKQLRLLSIPLHLSLLSEISKDSAIGTFDFDTSNDLYDKFWEQKQGATSQRLGEPIDIASLWNKVIDALCDRMSDNQVLYAPDFVIEDYDNIAKAMVSEHVLILDNETYSFFHEGFFDYAFARRFIARGQTLLSLLLRGEQHLFRRAQVRQILLYEHDKERNRYTEDLEALLTSSKIRFHIKKVTFAIMKGLNDPMIGEWNIIASLLGKAGDTCSRESMRVLWGSIPWFELLDSLGVVKKWLADEDERIIERAIILIVGVQKNLPRRVAELVEPYVDVSDQWNKRLVRLMEISDIDIDRRFFDFTLKLIDIGILDEVESFNPFEEHFWYRHAKKLVDRNPDWAAQYIGHYLNRSLFRSIRNGRRNPFERNSHIIPNNIRINDVLHNFLYGIARSASEEFIDETLQFMLNVVMLAAEYDAEAPYYDSIWKSKPYNEALYVSDSILMTVEAALSNLARTKPRSFKFIADQLKYENYRTIQYLLIRSYAANGEQFAVDAGNYLCNNYPSSFETGYSSSPHWATRQLLEAITPYCSNEQLSQLEDMILGYYPDWENRAGNDYYRGFAQFILIKGIYHPRRSITVSCRLSELSKSFEGKPIAPKDFTVNGGIVESPISEEDAEGMNDEQWLDAIALYNDPNKVHGTSDPFVGGAHELSAVLEKQVRKDPERFAKLVQKFPDATHKYYFKAILHGIIDTPLDIETVLIVCRRCHQLPTRPCGRWICEPIAKLAEFGLPDEALDIVAWYATKDPDPVRESWRAEKPGEVPYWGGDILMAGLNSARGIAAMAMGTLISWDQKRINYFRSTLERMVRDPSISVRSLVAIALNAVLIHDKDLAVKLFQQLCETEDILLGTHHVEEFLRYSLVTHFDSLRPILERMLSSDNLDVVRVGTRQACLASLQIDDAKLLAEACLSGTKTQRLGAAEVFAANIRTHAVPCVDNLILLFNDESDDIKSTAASCFREFKDDELGKFVPLIEAFIKSPAFKISESDLIWALEKTTAEIPQITYQVCELLIETIKSGDDPLAEHDISTLVLRLYGQEDIDEVLRIHCLDLIDRIMQIESHGLNRELDKGLSLFDR